MADAVNNFSTNGQRAGAINGPLPTVSLPKGGGAIRGLGESLSINAGSGSSGLTLPLPISPGRDGFGPQLALTYSSGTGNGAFGFGWSLSLPAITRKTDKGLPRYGDDAESDVFLLSGADDLVPVLGETGQRVKRARRWHGVDYQVRIYRPRIEGAYTRIERWTAEATGISHWRTIGRDNIVTLYGTDPTSRIVDPANPKRVFSYLIAAATDNRGNLVRYDYVNENALGVDKTLAHEALRSDAGRRTQRYLKSVRYANGQPWFPDWSADGTAPPDPDDWYLKLVFDYGDHDAAAPSVARDSDWMVRPDPFSTFRSGFDVRTYRRCRRIMMFHNFPQEPEIGADGLVRSLDLTYADELAPPVPGQPSYSFLAAATQIGYRRKPGGYDKSDLPPIEFSYSQPRIAGEILTLSDSDSRTNLPQGLDGMQYRFIDLDGEGLPGVLSGNIGGWSYKKNLSPQNIVVGAGGSKQARAKFAPVEQLGDVPAPDITAAGQQLLDMDGDGQIDLVCFNGPTPGFRPRTRDGWAPLQAFGQLPDIDWANPNLQLIDLTGDGLADILLTDPETFTCYRSLGREGFALGERIAISQDERDGPRLVYSDGTGSVFFADMSGGGLSDLVRIRNGEVCYWPSLGYGNFGRRITLDGVRRFDRPERFDARRIRLADIDGSGTADLIYIGEAGVDLYFNLSGNALGKVKRLAVFPDASSLSNVQVMDLLGNGTSCLVWSSPLPATQGAALRYVDLMGSQKPHLLTSVRNNLGAETRIAYAPSTRFYLDDRAVGKPWVTRIPFPVQVVERVEVYDWIGRSRAVTRYAYHHGHYDGVEREFRGFGMVERWDTETHRNDTLFPEAAPLNEAATSFSPPTLTRTWFHTGAYFDKAAILRQFASEYWLPPPLRANTPQAAAARAALAMQESFIDPGLTADERREACRAMKGAEIRVETYGLDGTAQAETPYTVTERSMTVRRLQGFGPNRHAVFQTFEREVVTHHYERKPDEPRVSHELTFEVDRFGNTKRGASVAYGRKAGFADPMPELSTAFRGMLRHDQTRLHVSAVSHAFTASLGSIEDPAPIDTYRGPMISESVSAELTGLVPTGERFAFAALDAEMVALWQGHDDVPYEDVSTPDVEGIGNPLGRGRRIVSHSRTFYRSDDLSHLLPFGVAGSLALSGESFRLVFTTGLIDRIFQGRISPQLLAEGGYVQIAGFAGWWSSTGRVYFSPGTADTAPQERAEARAHFYRPRRTRDPFGAVERRNFDPYDLLPREAIDAVGNVTTVGNDYRVLGPVRSTDPNGTLTEISFDRLGRVVASAVQGKAGEGDRLTGFSADPSAAAIAAALANPLQNPKALLGNASSRIVHDPFAYMRTQHQPNPDAPVVYALSRETHVADLAPGAETRYQHRFVYSDGFGREVQHKAQAEPGPLSGTAGPTVPRWVGSGWTVYNNKGQPVQKFEPFFTATHGYEFNRQQGVSTTSFYDPAGRVVAVLHPDDTFEKTVVDAWGETEWDCNDCALIADPRNDSDVGDYFRRLLGNAPGAFISWHDKRGGGVFGATPAERNAAKDAAAKTAAHAATPSFRYFDPLGRVCLSADDAGPSGGPSKLIAQRTALDTESKPLVLIDALGRHVSETCLREVMPGGGAGFRYVAGYDMIGNPLIYATMDSGARLTFPNIAGHPIRHWDARGFAFRTIYDAARRPTHHYVMPAGGAETLAELFIYGEGHPDAARNLRGKLFRHYDTSGCSTQDRHDFKGNLVESSRQLALSYRTSPDWSALAALNGVPLDLATLDAAAAVFLSAQDRFIASAFHNALDHPVQTVLPHRVGGRPCVIQPTFNEANLLESIRLWVRQAAEPAGLLNPATATMVAVSNIDYNAQAQRIRLDRSNGCTTTWDYDPLTRRLRNLTTTRPHANSQSRTVQALSYTYDAHGNLTRLRDDADTNNVVFFKNQRVDPSADYTYDSAYRLTKATGREHLGQNGGLAAPQQVSSSDILRMRLASPGDGNAVGTYTERYSYDLSGNLEEMVHLVATGNWTRRYAYAEASAISAGEVSNRLSATSLPGDPSAGPFSETYGYDAHGNMTRMPHLALMTWDSRDRLASTARQVVNAGTPETTYYCYDATGQRVRKITDRQTGAQILPTRKSERIYLGGLEIHREYAADGIAIRLERETLNLSVEGLRVLSVETRTIGQDPAPAQLFRHQFGNHLGSATLELDDQGDLISYEEYFPFGATSYQAVRSQTETPRRYRYTGMERDEESDLNYHGARYYAPWLGRWTACDPKGHGDGPNVYAYAHNKPSFMNDPTGTEGEGDDKKSVTGTYSTPFAILGTLTKLPDFLTSGKLREAALKLNIDEIVAVSQGGSWSDPRNKQFLDWLTNQATKGGATWTHTIPPREQISLAEEFAKGPDAFRKAAMQLMTRNFGEVKELESLTQKAQAAMRKLNRPPRKLADAINKSIRGRIGRAATTDAKIVSDALKEIGINPKTLTFMKTEGQVAAEAAEATKMAKLAPAVAKAVPTITKAVKAVAPVTKVLKPLAPAAKVLGKVAGPLSVGISLVELGTAKNTNERVDAGIGLVGNSLLMSKHPVAMAAGGGLLVGQAIEHNLNVSEFASQHGIDTKEYLESKGVNETAAFVAGGIVTVASTPIAIQEALISKVASWF